MTGNSGDHRSANGDGWVSAQESPDLRFSAEEEKQRGPLSSKVSAKAQRPHRAWQFADPPGEAGAKEVSCMMGGRPRPEDSRKFWGLPSRL